MANEYVVGLDVGTQSTRVIIFDKAGKVVSNGSRQHQPHMIRQPGWAEHPMGDLWNAFTGACRDAIKDFSGELSEIKAFGLSTQRCTRVFVNNEGELIQPIMSWLDIRTLVPHQPGPDYEGMYKMLTNSGYYCYRLTGEYADTYGNLSGIIYPFSQETHDWLKDPEEFKKYNLTADQLPTLKAPGEVLGHLTAQAAFETGLPEGLPVIAAAGDKQVEVLGAGAINEGQAYITCGTYVGFILVGKQYLEDPSLGCYIAPHPGVFHYEGYGVRRGFWNISWFARNFGAITKNIMENRGISCEAALDLMAEQIPVGCEGLMFAPDFVPPSAEYRYRRGGFFGLDGSHTAAHMYRAVLEGIALSLKMNTDWMLNNIKKDVTEIRIGGGGSKSTVCMQIFADVFGLPVVRTTNPESCALGAAIDAAVGCGMYDSFESAVDGMVHIRDTFEPYPDRHKFYSELQEEVYKYLRPTTDPLYIKSQDFWDRWNVTNPDLVRYPAPNSQFITL